MRLSYYGGGHYDSVSPVVGEHGAGAVGVTFEPILEPGRLEEDALERSRRRVRDAGGGRCETVDGESRGGLYRLFPLVMATRLFRSLSIK